MTAEVTGSAAYRRDDGRGAVPQDEGAALSTVGNGEAAGAMASVGGLLRGLTSAAGEARPVGREATRLARDCVRIVRGTDEHQPSPKDTRLADPAWSQDPVARRLSRTWLAAGGVTTSSVDELEADWHDVNGARFAIHALTSALARPGRSFVEHGLVLALQSDPGAWRDSADRRTSSWRRARSGWVLERSGEPTSAPTELGSDRCPPLEPAPGSYVRSQVLAATARGGQRHAAARGRK
jgi:hypothetical protein